MNRRRLPDYVMMILLFGVGWGCTTLPPCSAPETTPPSASLPTPMLQQRVKEQGKRIAELTTQLDMLKRIDQGRMRIDQGRMKER